MRPLLRGAMVLVDAVATAVMVMRCDAMAVCDGDEAGVDGDEAGVDGDEAGVDGDEAGVDGDEAGVDGDEAGGAHCRGGAMR